MKFKDYYLLEDNMLVKAFDQLSLSSIDLDYVTDTFLKVNTFRMPDGTRTSGGFKTLFNLQGLKPLEDMSAEELRDYVSHKIRDDIEISREEIKDSGQNPIDFMLDRALDPLDPMKGLYRIFLGKLGADVSGKGIKLTPELNRAMKISVNKQLS